MDKIFSKLIETAFGPRAQRFWGVILIIVLLSLVLYPYIDANFLAYNRISQRIELLDRVTRLDIEKIEADRALLKEYEAILYEMDDSRINSVAQLATSNQGSLTDYWIKFLGGGLIFFIVSISVLFSKRNEASKMKRFFYRFGGFILSAAIGWLFGFIATKIPTLVNAWVNAVLFPVVILIILALFMYGNLKNKTISI